MTVTASSDDGFPLGPGELKIGATGTEIDISCLVNNAVITPSKDEGDSTTKLCGDVVPGAISYTYALEGNVDLDIAEDTGFFALSQSAPGSRQDFTFTPNSDAGTSATGVLIIDPLPFGGADAGETMTGDFSFTIVSHDYTYGGVTAAAGGKAGKKALVDA